MCKIIKCDTKIGFQWAKSELWVPVLPKSSDKIINELKKNDTLLLNY